MIHEILPIGPLQCNCSVIGDETTHDAIVIDPGDDIEDVLGLIQKHNLKVKQIVITHAHIDHVGGAMKLRAATGPLPSVVRSSFGSWQSTGTPSPVRRTSNSTQEQPSALARRKPASVFSGARAAAPRCPMTAGSSRLENGKIGNPADSPSPRPSPRQRGEGE